MRGRQAVRAALSARLVGHIALEARSGGEIAACFDGRSVALGKFSAGAAERAQDLRKGLLLGASDSDGPNISKEVHLLVRRLARLGLLEYRFAPSPDGNDRVVV